jgi:hypothetical protein
MRTTRRAVTLVEILIAAALLATITMAMMQLLSVTQRQVGSSEALMNTAMISQLVIERIKGQVAMNPRWFRDTMGANAKWTSTGTAVDPAVAVNPKGLPLSPFAEHLFAREAAEVGAPANRVAITRATATSPTGLKSEELGSLVDLYRDVQITVEIAHDVDLTSPTPTALAELVKRITVTIARASVAAAQGKDPLAFTVTARMPTPAESLSDAAYDQLCARFEPPTLEEQHEQYLEAAGQNKFITTGPLGDTADRILADAFLILAGANNEWMLLEGRCIPNSTVVDAKPGAEYLDTWIARLDGVKELSSSKRELAHLRVRRASTVLGAFKRMRLPMEHFIAALLPPGPGAGKLPLIPRIKELKDRVDAMLRQVRTLRNQAQQAMNAYNGADGTLAGLDAADPANATQIQQLQAQQTAAYATMRTAMTDYDAVINGFRQPNPVDQETITLASFLVQLFTDPAYRDAAARPIRYATEFRATLRFLVGILTEHLDQPTNVTAAERAGASRLLVEAVAMRLAANEPDAPAGTARLKLLATQMRARIPELARYIEGSEAMDAARARARHARFAATAQQLDALTPRYKQIVDYFNSPEPADTIKLWEEMVGQANGTGEAGKDGKDIADMVKNLMEKIKSKS